jgi:guanylate kinase
MENKEGKFFVISAPSGAGKTTLERMLFKDKPGIFYNSISDTTRGMRSGEIDGLDYNFITVSEFEANIEDGEYLEWANVHENFYGELKAPLFDAMKEGLFPLLVLDVQGYFQIRENIDYDKLCSIFILPPNQRELVRRIRNRGEMSDKDLEIRLENSRNECAVAGEFKYCLTNDNLDVTYSILKFIMEREMMG